MKRNIIATIIALGMLLCLLSGAGTAEQAYTGRYRVFSSPQQDFSFLYDSDFRAEWNNTAGAIVYTMNGDDFPRMQMHRSIYGNTTGFSVEEYFYFEIEETKARLGANLLSVGALQTYNVSGVEIPGVLIDYTENGRNVTLFSLMQNTGESLIKYSCLYYQGSGDLTLQALAEAVGSYQPEAGYYVEIGGGTPAQAGSSGQDAPRPAQSAPALSLVKYDGGFFSVMLPAGWRIQTMGQYNTFSFRAWDPQSPDYQIFYYGKMNSFLKSDAAKAVNRKYAGISHLCAFYGDTIVVEPDDATMLFSQWNDFTAFVAKHSDGVFYPPGYSFPSLANFSVIDSIPLSTFYASVASAEAIVTGSFQSEHGTDCFAKLCASLVPGYPTYLDGVDCSIVEAYGVSGVLAPKEGFLSVEQILTEAIYSLDFTQAYVAEANAYTLQSGEAAMAANAALQKTYDRYNAAWRSYISEHDLFYAQDNELHYY